MFAGLLFDFDGVLIESEYAGNAHLATALTALGHPLSTEDAMAHFMGLSGEQFLDAIAAWIGRPVPDAFHAVRDIENARVLAEGVDAVAGALAFLRSLPDSLPRAIVSSSSTRWITTHLAHLGLQDYFGAHIFSGREHVARGKPAPDIYLHAADMLGIDIAQTLIIEDSPVGVTGAVASGGYVVGLCAGKHCASDHGEKLRALGARRIAHGFDEIAALLN